MECPICFETCEGVRTLCGHTFCSSCISKVAYTTLTCPLCRELLLDEKASCKVLNETIVKSMEGQPNFKRHDLLNRYKEFSDQVEDGTLLEEDMGTELISSLIQLVGTGIVQPHMRTELSAAVIGYETYMETPYEDWRFYKM
jgi:predicted amidophosphoribosyltransferase